VIDNFSHKEAFWFVYVAPHTAGESSRIGDPEHPCDAMNK